MVEGNPDSEYFSLVELFEVSRTNNVLVVEMYKSVHENSPGLNHYTYSFSMQII